MCVHVLRKDTFKAPVHVRACTGMGGMSWAAPLHSGVCLHPGRSGGEICSCAHNQLLGTYDEPEQKKRQEEKTERKRKICHEERRRNLMQGKRWFWVEFRLFHILTKDWCCQSFQFQPFWGVSCQLIVVLICICLKTNEVQHVLMCLLPPSLAKGFFKSFVFLFPVFF